MKKLIDSATPVGRILRMRPLAVEALERIGRYRLWENLESSLDEYCRLVETDEAKVLAALRTLVPADPSTDWQARPIYHLVDRLTEEHTAFREEHLPHLHRLLDPEQAPPFPDREALRPLQSAFTEFDREFRRHMEEEEGFLFPKIMRNEACFRYREMSPEIYRGSVNLYLTAQNHPLDEDFRRTLASLRGAARAMPASDSLRTHLDRALEGLQAFGRRLEAHAKLEDESLFPRAGRLEQELYENAAPGVSVFPDKG
jgi:iron-sulfur cluster repair protein YtfE (RIC family)